jgi:hypothetical protein
LLFLAGDTRIRAFLLMPVTSNRVNSAAGQFA